MRFVRLLRDGFSVYAENLTAFVLAMLCAAAGSIFIVTAPPLLFGLYSMGVKAAKGQAVEVKDLLDGFRYTLKSFAYVILVFILILAGTGASYTIVKSLKLPATAALLIVASASICWTTLILFSLVYAVPSIVSKNRGVIEAVEESMRRVYWNFPTTLLLFVSLTAITVLIGWIPVLGPLVVIPYQVITYSKAALEL